MTDQTHGHPSQAYLRLAAERLGAALSGMV
jgi:hypothetical protein